MSEYEKFEVTAGKFVIPDFIVFMQDGAVVGKVHATFDVCDLPPNLWHNLPIRRIRFGLPSAVTAREYDLRAMNLHERLNAWKKLTRWQRLWRRKPSFWDDETLASPNL